MATITLRGVSADTLEKLKSRARDAGMSMNKLIIQKLDEEVGNGGKRLHNDLDHLFGSMTAEDCRAVCEASTEQRKVDAELWN